MTSRFTRRKQPRAHKNGEQRDPAPIEPEVLDPDTDTESDAVVVDPEDSPDLGDLPIEAESESAESSEAASHRREIIPYDPLTIYLREISKHPHLSREEEHSLAVRYVKTKDRDAAYRLLVSNLWLVVKIAREYERAAKNLLDLVQEGNIGLIEAVKNFDPYRGVRFPSYAMWWVRAYIIRYLIANWRMVKIGTTQSQRKLFFNLRKEREKLEREGFVPSTKLLAEKLNVKEGEVIEMEQRLGASELSVDAPLQDDNEQTMHALIPAEGGSAEDSLAQKEMQQLILKSFEEFSATLNQKEQVIFRHRMLNEEKATLQDISEQLEISRERVRQIENRIREKLKAFLIERLGSDIADYGGGTT